MKLFKKQEPPKNKLPGEEKYPDMPAWGVAVFASAAALYAFNIKNPLPLLFAILCLSSLFIKKRFTISRFYGIIIHLVVTGFFFLIIEKSAARSFNIFGGLSGPFYFGGYFLCSYFTLACFRHKTKQSFHFAYLAAFLLSFNSSIFAERDLDAVNIVLFCCFAVSSVMYLVTLPAVLYKTIETEQKFSPLKSAALVIAVAVILAVSVHSGISMKYMEPAIMQSMAQSISRKIPASIFMKTVQLGTIENITQSGRVVMRVFRPGGPVRVKGNIYNRYGAANWSVEDVEKSEIKPTSEYPVDISRMIPNPGEMRVFNIHSLENPGSINPDEIWHEKYHFFIPRNNLVFRPEGAFTAFINKDLPYGYVEKDSIGNVYTILPDTLSYELAALKPGDFDSLGKMDPPSDMDLQVPDSIRDDFTRIAKGVVDEDRPGYYQAFQIEQHLQNNYKYRAGVKLTTGMDPVQEFLVEKRAAHCEYFASAMALMLRSLGIPSRYTVGFIVHEYKTPGGYYTVREKDAHAWVLVYIPERGWVEFDPTPPAQRPGNIEDRSGNDWVDYVKMKMELMYRQIRTGRLRQALKELGALLKKFIESENFPRLIILIAALAVIWAAWKKLRVKLPKMKRGETEYSEEEPGVRSLHEIMARFDKTMVLLNLERPKNATLNEYGEMVNEKEIDNEIKASVLDFLKIYGDMRYGNRLDKENIKNLEQQVGKIDEETTSASKE